MLNVHSIVEDSKSLYSVFKDVITGMGVPKTDAAALARLFSGKPTISARPDGINVFDYGMRKRKINVRTYFRDPVTVGAIMAEHGFSTPIGNYENRLTNSGVDLFYFLSHALEKFNAKTS